jgi:RNA polymerase sigma-70 factor (ECF subfamily)
MDNATVLNPESWVEEHGDSLFRFAVLRVRDADTASDLVQETFLAALRVRDTYSGRSSVRSWLVAILKHKIADHLRRIGREQRFQEGRVYDDRAENAFDQRGLWRAAPLDWGSDPLREFQRREFWDVLGRCLSRLPPHLADAFLERELDGLSREAICQDLKITPENLSVQLFRARLLVRRCLEVHWFCGQEARSEGTQARTWATAKSLL